MGETTIGLQPRHFLLGPWTTNEAAPHNAANRALRIQSERPLNLRVELGALVVSKERALVVGFTPGELEPDAEGLVKVPDKVHFSITANGPFYSASVRLPTPTASIPLRS